MKSHASDEANGVLTEEELKEIEQVVLREPDEDLTFARVFEVVGAKNPNAVSDEFFIANEDEGNAEIVVRGQDAPGLTLSNERVLYRIDKAKIEFTIEEEDIQQSRAYGTPLDTQYVERAKRAVEEKMNSYAYAGDQKTGVPGILSIQNPTAITGTDWTAPALDIANEVDAYLNQIPRKYRGQKYTLVLGDGTYTKLTAYFNSSSAVGDRSHMERIKSAHPNLSIVNEEQLDAGTVLHNGNTLPAGVGLLIPGVARLCRMKLAKAPYTKVENEIVKERLNGMVASRFGIVETPFPSAIGYVTGLLG